MAVSILNKLKNELALQSYAGLSYIAASNAINEPNSGAEIVHDIDVGDMERYLASEGILLKLRDKAVSGKSGDAMVTNVTRELVALVDSPNVRRFNIHNARAQEGLTVLTNATPPIITAPQREAITALGKTAQTRGQEIGVGAVTPDDVMRARTL